jgi:hypothetical protein
MLVNGRVMLVNGRVTSDPSSAAKELHQTEGEGHPVGDRGRI